MGTGGWSGGLSAKIMVPRAALCFDLQPGGLVHHHPYYAQICSMVFWSRTRTYHFGLTPIFISALCRCTVKWSQVYDSPILCFSVLLSAIQLRTLKCDRSTAFCNWKFSFVYLFLFGQVQFFVHPAGVGSRKVGPRSPAVHCQTAPCVTPCHMSTKIIIIIVNCQTTLYEAPCHMSTKIFTINVFTIDQWKRLLTFWLTDNIKSQDYSLHKKPRLQLTSKVKQDHVFTKTITAADQNNFYDWTEL